MSEVDNPINSAFPEPVNYFNSTQANQVNKSDSDSPNAMAAIAPYKLVALIQDLHSSNSNLVKRSYQLEQALAECSLYLQSYEKRSTAAESMLTKQSQELAVAQEQIEYLFHKLEATQQTNTRQQILIETLTAQLESSQERVAQLERECFLTQASYNEQSHQLVQTENNCRELRTRLTRQQRHTLQFKVALEKCLEVPVPSAQFQADTDVPSVTTKPLDDFKNALYSPLFLTAINRQSNLTVCLPKPQPIQPWSAQLQFAGDLEPAWNSQFSPMPPTTWAESSKSLFTPHSYSSDWSTEYSSTPAEEEPLKVVGTDNSSDSHVATFSQQPSETFASWQTLEEQIDAVMQLFIDPPPSPLPAELSLTIDLQEVQRSESDSSEVEEAHWQYLVSLLEDGEELGSANSQNNLPEGATVVPSTNEVQLTSAPQQKTSSFTSNTTWPSAVVYPLRPPKGRKSLAEIELPPFS